jgi:phage/plasmid primase-like uncharacterized protein
MNRLPDIKEQVAGNWTSVLHAIGMDKKLLNGKHHTCLFCGRERHGRWVVDKNFYICSCGAKSAIDVGMQYLGMNYKQSVKHIRYIIGNRKMTPVEQTHDREKNEKRIKSIAKGLVPVSHENASGRYLAKRGISILPTVGVAHHPGVPYYDDNGKNQGIYPALVGIIRQPSGELESLQINYITEAGDKLDKDPNRKNLPVINSLTGAIVKLGEITPSTSAISIVEGICTGLGWLQENGGVVWCAISANNLEKIQVPEQIETVYIIVDNDDSWTGQHYSTGLARRLKIKDKKTVHVVQVIYRDNEVMEYMEQPTGMDYLDYLLAKKKRDQDNQQKAA